MKKGIKLIDNSSNEYQLGSVLKEILSDDFYSQISIATGYWDLPGMVDIYEKLKTFLERENTSFRLLPGEEPSVKAYQVKRPALQDLDFPQKYLKKYLEDLQLKEEFQKVAGLLVKYLHLENDRKLQIKVYRKNFLHAKCYIFGTDEENATIEKDIDVLVYKLYELTYDEVKIIHKDFWLSEEDYDTFK